MAVRASKSKHADKAAALHCSLQFPGKDGPLVRDLRRDVPDHSPEWAGDPKRRVEPTVLHTDEESTGAKDAPELPKVGIEALVNDMMEKARGNDNIKTPSRIRKLFGNIRDLTWNFRVFVKCAISYVYGMNGSEWPKSVHISQVIEVAGRRKQDPLRLKSGPLYPSHAEQFRFGYLKVFSVPVGSPERPAIQYMLSRHAFMPGNFSSQTVLMI